MRIATAVCFVLLMGLCGIVAGQEAMKQPTAAKKITHTLPPGFSKLGLDNAQKAQAYKIVDEHRLKIKEATDAAASWRAHERTELMKLLTPTQRDTLLKMSGLDFAPAAPEVKK